MGTRIHKVMGWGFKYCKFEDDPRFNKEFFGNDDDILDAMISANKKNLKSKDFRTKMNAQWFKRWIDDSKIKHLNRHDVFCYNGAIGYEGKHPIVFTDPTHKDWSRYDNIIDYYEAERDDRGYYPDYVKFILDGANQPAQMYPYCAFVNRNTGKHMEKMNQSDRWSITNLYFDSDHKGWKWKEFQKNWGVKNIIQWQRDIVPEPSYFIRLFCEVTKPFKNPLTVYRLKPMIFTYWC